MPRRPSDNRQYYYTLLSVGKRELGWDEDTYRAFLAAQGATVLNGRVSASTMETRQLMEALEAMKSKGFTPRRKRRATPDWRTARIKKAYKLWCLLYDAGVVRNKQFLALERWARSLTKTAKLEWASTDGLNQVIEGLKDWARRERVPDVD